MPRRRLGLSAALLALAIGCSKPAEQPQGGGQAASAPGPDGKPVYEVSYTGYTSRVYDRSQEDCVNATKVALQRLGLRVDEESGTLFKKSFTASGADGTSAAVYVVELGKTASRVSVKVGYLLGDRDAAQRIHSEIDGELTRPGGGGGSGAAPAGLIDWTAPPPSAARVTTTSRPPVTFWTQPAPQPTLPPVPPPTLPAPPPTLPAPPRTFPSPTYPPPTYAPPTYPPPTYAPPTYPPPAATLPPAPAPAAPPPTLPPTPPPARAPASPPAGTGPAAGWN